MLYQQLPGPSRLSPLKLNGTVITSERLEADGATAETVKLEQIQKELKEGWTVHIGKEGRLYYCNHVSRTAVWVPPVDNWEVGDELPYGWEKAIDSSGKTYYINHVNKTTTYVAPEVSRRNESPPEPRDVTIERSPEYGFGFVAGSEKPVVVRFVTENSPSVDKLQPGDEIWCVNGEDVRDAAREHVIATVKASTVSVTLRVCQPCGGRRGALLSASKKAKLRKNPARVRFADSVQVNGSPLYPPSAFSLGDLCLPPMANVLKVFLENGQTKSFKYDTTTTVADVFNSLKEKLGIIADEHFSLVVEHISHLRRSKLTILDPKELLARIASEPGAHKLRCVLRVSFWPRTWLGVGSRDQIALDYAYSQATTDVARDMLDIPEQLLPRMAALHMLHHALDNNYTNINVKSIEREFGLERFVPISLLENMKFKRKEIRKAIADFLKLNMQMMANQSKETTQLQVKLQYLDILASLPSYGAKCFTTFQPERLIIISPKFGLSHIITHGNSQPQSLASFDELHSIRLCKEDDVTNNVTIYLNKDRVISLNMEDKDGIEMALVLAGYYKVTTGQELNIEQEREPINEDIAPPYVSQHNVIPAKWSYITSDDTNQIKKQYFAVFSMPPPYHSTPNSTNADNNMNSSVNNRNHMSDSPLLGYDCCAINNEEDDYRLFNKNDLLLLDDGMGFDLNSVLSMELVENDNPKLIEAKNEEVLKRLTEMQNLVENSERYLTENGDVFNEERNMHDVLSDKNVVGKETCVDQLESDNESINSRMSSDDAPGILRHSDSLILLTENINNGVPGLSKNHTDLKVDKPSASLNKRQSGLSALLNNCVLSDTLNSLSNDLSQSESDNDSTYTPTNSPVRRHDGKNQQRRTSFTSQSPDGSPEIKEQNLKEYLKQLKEQSKTEEQEIEIIDLTLIPPPQTPDALDSSEKVPQILPIVPFSFADDLSRPTHNIKEDKNLDDFLATVTVPPPLGVSSDTVLSPEEISSYIIPPPPLPKNGTLDRNGKRKENTNVKTNSEFIKGVRSVSEITKMFSNNPFNSARKSALNENKSPNKEKDSPDSKRKNKLNDTLTNGHSGQVIDYPTVDRKGMFSCCSKDKTKDEDQPDGVEKPEQYEETHISIPDVCEIKPPPRKRNSDNKQPPERPPKTAPTPAPRPRSESFSAPQREFSLTPGNYYNTFTNRKMTYNMICENNEETSEIVVPKPVPPPQIPPRLENTQYKPSQAPTPPKKPPLPPVPSLEVLKIKQRLTSTRNPNDKHAMIGSPHFQRNLSAYKSMETEQRTFTEESLNGQVRAITKYQTLQSRHLRPTSDINQTIRPNDSTNIMSICSPQANRKFGNRPDLLNGAPTFRVCNSSPVEMRGNSPSSIDRRFNGRDMTSPQFQRRGLTSSSCRVNSPRVMSPNSRGSSPIIEHAASSLRMSTRVRFEENCSNDLESVVKLLRKTDIAVDGLLSRLHNVAETCSHQHAHGGGLDIDEAKFQTAKTELTNCAVSLVCSSRSLVGALGSIGSGQQEFSVPNTLASCLTPLRKLTELSQDLGRHTSAPLQTRNLVLRVHDVTAAFKELSGNEMADILQEHYGRNDHETQQKTNIDGQLALRAECLANVLATLLRSLRVFSP